MKKNAMKEINKAEKEFDEFVQNEHTEFLCSLVSGLLAVASAAVFIIGQYSKHIKDDEEREEVDNA